MNRNSDNHQSVLAEREGLRDLPPEVSRALADLIRLIARAAAESQQREITSFTAIADTNRLGGDR